MCRICFMLAVGPKLCACKTVICSECCEFKARYNESGAKKYLLLAKPHLIAASEFKSRANCEGPVGELSAEDQEEWSKNMLFKCIYRCGALSLPYAELEDHIKNTCPFRPRFCVNKCGDFRLHDPETVPDTQPYTCEKCFLKTVPQ